MTAAILVVAYVAGRPAWLVRLTSRSRGAVSATASRTASAAADARSEADLAGAVRQNRSAVERFGIGAIAFAVVWLAIGLEVALLGAALVVAWLLIVRIVSAEPEPESASAPAVASGPADSAGPAGPPVEAEAT